MSDFDRFRSGDLSFNKLVADLEHDDLIELTSEMVDWYAGNGPI